MPVLSSTDRIAPRSILRHRPIGDSAAQDKDPITNPPVASRASRQDRPEADVPEVVLEWASQRERGTAVVKPKEFWKKIWGATVLSQSMLIKQRRHSVQIHPLLYLGLGMIVTVLLWALCSSTWNWVEVKLDDLRYGRPRTFQIDMYVGHNEESGLPSHFIAMNLNRHIEIIELPGGDATRARVYMGPQFYGAQDDLIPVKLKFIDVNGDHKPDMVVEFQNSHVVFINDQSEFRQVLPSEREKVDRYLQHAE